MKNVVKSGLKLLLFELFLSWFHDRSAHTDVLHCLKYLLSLFPLVNKISFSDIIIMGQQTYVQTNDCALILQHWKG